MLTLTGSDTPADYQAALALVTYSFSPSGGDATAGGTDTSRGISWQVTDGSVTNDQSNAAASTLTVPTTPVVIAAANINASASESFTAGAAVLGERRRGRARFLSYQIAR